MTLAELRELRAAWYAAELAVATGQSYTIGGRSLTRTDAKVIKERLQFYDGQIAAVESGADVSGGVRTLRFVPRDL